MILFYNIMIKLLSITKSHLPDKKYDATFKVDNHTKTIPFGASGYTDFIKSGGDKERRDRYDARHKSKEHWNDPMSRGALSKFILWNKPTLSGSIKDFKSRFNV